MLERKKKTGRLGMLFLCCLMLLTMACAVEARAAKNGLVTSKGKTYFYQNGKKLKNQWKSQTKNGKKVWYYFGKDGAAYKAKKVAGMSKNIVVKTIGGKKYGFDRNGYRVSGTYSTPEGQVYHFAKNGKLDKTTTQKYRKALKYLGDAKKIRKYWGKPKKTAKSSSCFGEGGTDLWLTYDNVYLLIYEDPKGKQQVLGISPR